MEPPLSVLMPSLLLSCGARPGCFCSFSDGCVCELSGRYLRLSNPQGVTEYIPLYATANGAAEAPEDACCCGYTTIASHDREKLVALGASGSQGEIQVLQLSPMPPKCLWRRRLRETSLTEILSLDFSPCGRRLFCLLRGVQEQQQQRQIIVHHIAALNVCDGEVQACHLLRWDDSPSLPCRLLATTGGTVAVLSETNLMLLQLLENGEEGLVTSGLLLPPSRAAGACPTVGAEGGMTICGACWVGTEARGGQSSSSSTSFLFLSLSTRMLLAIGVGWLGAAGPHLAWVTRTEEIYVSLAAEEGTGILVGCTDAPGLDSFRLNEAAALYSQGSEQNGHQQQDIEASVSVEVVLS